MNLVILSLLYTDVMINFVTVGRNNGNP